MFFAAEPTAMQLITTFLDKAGCIEGGQVESTEEKREVLVDCALLIAATVVKWDLDTFEKRCMFQCYQSLILLSFFLILLRIFPIVKYFSIRPSKIDY